MSHSAKIRQGALNGIRRLGPLGGPGILLLLLWRVGDVANVLTRLILGRLLTTTDFGALDPFLTVIVFCTIPVTVVYRVGIKSISRLLASGQTGACASLIRDIIRICAAGSILSAIMLVLFRAYILERLHLEGNAFVPILAAMVVLAWWRPLSLAIIQGSRRYYYTAIQLIGGPIVILVLSILFVFVLRWEVVGSLYARIAADVVCISIVAFLLRNAFNAPPESYRHEMTHIRDAILPMTIYGVSIFLLAYFDRLLVRNYLLDDSGGYAAVITLGQVPQWLIAPFAFVLFPLASAEHAQGRDTTRMYWRAVVLGAVITALCAIGYHFFAAPIVRFWKPGFVPYGAYVWRYATAAGLLGMLELIGSVEMARHRYGFLWLLAVAAISMCAILYRLSDALSIGNVILTLIVSRALCLGGVLIYSVMTTFTNKKGKNEDQE